MIDLFNCIKQDAREDGGDGVYSQRAFENAFEGVGDFAVVASRPENNRIITLTRDYTATV